MFRHAATARDPLAMTTAIARERRDNLAVATLLVLAIGYNFLLAMFNASIHPVGASSAYAVELVIYAGCFLFGLRSLGRDGQLLVFTGLGLVLAFNLVRFLETWSFDLKLVRDAIIPFAFLTLGTAYRGRFHKLVLWLAVIVVLVAVFEMAFPNVYGDLVDPRAYFVNTRGNSEDDFWNEASKLYVSATRPGERNWLGGFELPRVSSIFVEPVTMGNFIIFFCAVAITFWRSLRVVGVAFSLTLILFLLIASDGRLASATCLLMLLLAPLLRRVDQTLAGFLFIGVLLVGWLAVGALGVSAYEDTMLGRVFVSVDAINQMSPREWFGMDLAAPYRYSDSGIAYFIAGQSIVVVLVFLIAYSFLLKMPTSNGQLFKNLFVVAFALSLLVSNAYFSIKTAGLWWFACGYFWRLPIPRTMPAVQSRPDARAAPTFDAPQATASS
ncbi:polysaccharide biosynthesis protein GumE [Pseudoxanthomonas sacheonensis]|uniref:Polymerase n=1 Tax=Pseudoxanthomonas sacheonensis TaxID=443615 RepID=A0ABU1RWD0_9GAMM|nr:polysaccharide biosynthesis protein GumE [Pseudoxanthomonas sacheonensis]MDR6843070.1 putative polymerase [Pseudoxanthomonas sacheonensis]